MGIVEVIFAILGGVALFLFGLKILSSGLRKTAGDRLRQFLEKATTYPIKGVVAGAFTTALIQSSSMTMVTLIGLINANLLNLNQAIGVMLGAEVGTTITAQLVAFKIGRYFLPIIALGFFLFFFTKERTKWHYFTNQANKCFGCSIKALEKDDMDFVEETLKIESQLDELMEKYQANNLKRLKKKRHHPVLGIVYFEVLRNLERISDHSRNIVLSLRSGF